jgi:hypothetical protein
MPKLRLSEVIAERSIIVADLSADVRETINTLLAQENTLGKINKATAENLRFIAATLNVSIFDLFTPDEKFYRLKIFENLNEPEYSGTPKEKLEKLFDKLPQSNKVSFSLLSIYATQVLPESLLKGNELRVIYKILDIHLEALKEISPAPNQTISVESVLKNLGITLDELSLLLEVPKKFIPWLSTNTIILSNDENTRSRITRLSLLENVPDELTNLFVDPCSVLCPILPYCPKPCR